MRSNRLAAVAAVALICSLFAGASQAAPKIDKGGKGPGVKMIDMIGEAARTLDLTTDQEGQLKEVLADAAAQADALRADAKAAGKGNKDAKKAMHEKMLTLAEKTRDNVKEILTTEQQPLFAKALADARAKAKDARKDKGDKVNA